MKASELRGKGVDELQNVLVELRNEQFKLRMQGRTGQSFKHDRLKKNRCDVARIRTLIREMEAKDE